MQAAPSPVSTPPAAALVNVEVESFASWKSVFEGHAPARRQAGILATQVHRRADDPRQVTVFLAAADFDTLGAFLASRERAEAMKRAGVVGTPAVSFVVPVEDHLVKDRPLAGALVRHQVIDLASWKAGFDGRKAARENAGIVGYAVCRAKDDPQDVFVYLQAESLERLRAFMGSQDLKSAMARGGVRGEARVSLVESEPFGS